MHITEIFDILSTCKKWEYSRFLWAYTNQLCRALHRHHMHVCTFNTGYLRVGVVNEQYMHIDRPSYRSMDMHIRSHYVQYKILTWRPSTACFISGLVFKYLTHMYYLFIWTMHFPLRKKLRSAMLLYFYHLYI